LGAIGGILFILLLIFCLIRKKVCCNPAPPDHPDINTDDYEKVPMEEEPQEIAQDTALIPIDSDGTNDPDSDKKDVPIDPDQPPDSFYMGEPSISQSAPDLTEGPPMSAYGDVASMPAVSAISLDNASTVSSISIASAPFALDNCRIEFSMFYSKSDMFLMIKVDNVQNVLVEKYTQFRVSLTLLPSKTYRVKTAFMEAIEGQIEYNESFKFSNVTRDNLFMASFRMRLYGKAKMGREKCLGECVVHLADVANRVGGFTTSRRFGPVKRKR